MRYDRCGIPFRTLTIRHRQSRILQLKHVIGLTGLRYGLSWGGYFVKVEAQHFGCVPFCAPQAASANLHVCAHNPHPTFLQIYSEFRLPAYPHLTPFIEHYSEYTQDPSTSVGGYWQQPGRSILANHLVEVPEPNREIFEPLERVYFTGEHSHHLLCRLWTYLHIWPGTDLRVSVRKLESGSSENRIIEMILTGSFSIVYVNILRSLFSYPSRSSHTSHHHAQENVLG